MSRTDAFLALPVSRRPNDQVVTGFRDAKSGELFEHGCTVQLLSGSAFVDEVPTYRGSGLAP